MKVSIVSISRDNGPALEGTISSVYLQELAAGDSLEHIIVEGGACGPEHTRAEKAGSKVIFAPPCGCYNALNIGISNCTGDLVMNIHGGDMLADKDVVARIIDLFRADGNLDFLYGDISYYREDPEFRLTGSFSGAGCGPDKLTMGLAPPHPSLVVRRGVFDLIGPYSEKYTIAGDFDYFVRLFGHTPRLQCRYEPMTVCLMRAGGLSARLKSRLWTNNSERLAVLRSNSLPANPLRLALHYFYRLKRSRK